jgi:hypothetical protein
MPLTVDTLTVAAVTKGFVERMKLLVDCLEPDDAREFLASLRSRLDAMIAAHTPEARRAELLRVIKANLTRDLGGTGVDTRDTETRLDAAATETLEKIYKTKAWDALAVALALGRT